MNASALRVAHLKKSYGRTLVLDDIDLTLDTGAVTALLGPSGCGKTTLLRLIAGFDRADSGSIELSGKPVATDHVWVAPHRRGIGYVPQEGALFPHLSIADNIGFGLSGSERRSGRVEALLTTIGMDGFGGRMPHELSGGQQQRVALARALAPSPSLVLLDEPFNALDAHLRQTLCGDVRRILKESNASGLIVTHDRDEAFSIADEIVVMRAGRVAQSGIPANLYEHPIDVATASVVGASICLAAQLHGTSADTALGSVPVRNPHGVPDGKVTIMLRPEQVLPSTAAVGQAVTVLHVASVGPLMWLDLALAKASQETLRFPACWLTSAPPTIGSTIYIHISGDALVFPDA